MTFSAVPHRSQGSSGLSAAIVASLVLHGGLVAAFMSMREARPAALPPIYRVNIVAAAAGDPSAGLVTPSAPVVQPTPAPPRPKTDEVMPVPTKTPPRREARRATPSVSETRVPRNTPAPAAGGGDQGGTGTDVATVRTEGIDFPYPGYLENIVRQIRLRFRPPRGSPLKAEVMFLIHRDGSVTQFRFLERSGSFTFDLEAQGAVESAAGAFGALPKGFADDVLPVVFSFDPRLIR